MPGSLLLPGIDGAAHSITLLLPDGQRILYECYAARDCVRGFRVPMLDRDPGPFAVEMMARIRARIGTVLARQDEEAGGTGHLARDEVVAELDGHNRVEFGGLSASLSNGDYSGDLQPLFPSGARRSAISLRKDGDSIALQLPGGGLYELIVSDSTRRARINVLVAAFRRGEGTTNERKFRNAQKRMQEWNEDYQGWPIHDFQRAYLRSLMTGAWNLSDAPAVMRASTERRQGATAEPEFSPRPGVFRSDKEVSLRCATPGAVIHYTVDSSEPFDSSPVYGAPIMVKGTALTIKAYSESPGKKDSAVVTGIFTVGDD